MKWFIALPVILLSGGCSPQERDAGSGAPANAPAPPAATVPDVPEIPTERTATKDTVATAPFSERLPAERARILEAVKKLDAGTDMGIVRIQRLLYPSGPTINEQLTPAEQRERLRMQCLVLASVERYFTRTPAPAGTPSLQDHAATTKATEYGSLDHFKTTLMRGCALLMANDPSSRELVQMSLRDAEVSEAMTAAVLQLGADLRAKEEKRSR